MWEKTNMFCKDGEPDAKFSCHPADGQMDALLYSGHITRHNTPCFGIGKKESVSVHFFEQSV